MVLYSVRMKRVYMMFYEYCKDEEVAWGFIL
jgi:hypothetical protein